MEETPVVFFYNRSFFFSGKKLDQWIANWLAEKQTLARTLFGTADVTAGVFPPKLRSPCRDLDGNTLLLSSFKKSAIYIFSF